MANAAVCKTANRGFESLSHLHSIPPRRWCRGTAEHLMIRLAQKFLLPFLLLVVALASAPVRPWRRGGAPHARAVRRPSHRRRQQAGPLGSHRRVHEARGADDRSRAVARARQVDQRPALHCAGDQRAGHPEEHRPLQGARAEALFPGRSADRRGARRDLPQRQGSGARDVQHSRDRDRRLADDPGARASTGHRRLAGDARRCSTTSSSSWCRA